jgi:DNA polymerase-3 subunit delta'
VRSYLSHIVGSESLRRRIGEDIARDTFSHAYIIEGEEGSGKHEMARAIAMALACENRHNEAESLPCGHCKSCRKIASGNCPDIITVQKESDKKQFGIDVIRELRRDVHVLPNDLNFKIYVLEDAHLMNDAAQNAFLLTLEEPPSFVFFLLLANKSELLLETTRSRAPVLRMQNVKDEDMKAYLLCEDRPAIARTARTLQQNAPEEFAALIRMSNGRIGRALTLLEEKKRAPLMAKREVAQSFCTLLASSTQRAKLLALVCGMEKTREDTVSQLLFIEDALRDLLALSLSDDAALTFFSDREAATDLAARFTASTLLSIIGATDEALTALNRNANVKLTLIRYHQRLTA